MRANGLLLGVQEKAKCITSKYDLCSSSLTLEKMKKTACLTPLLFLCSCDWGHRSAFQLPPSSYADTQISSELNDVATGIGWIEKRNTEGNLYYSSETGRYSNASPWFHLFNHHGQYFIFLREFNRGTPWTPSKEYRDVKAYLEEELKLRFGDEVKVIDGPLKHEKTP